MWEVLSAVKDPAVIVLLATLLAQVAWLRREVRDLMAAHVVQTATLARLEERTKKL